MRRATFRIGVLAALSVAGWLGVESRTWEAPVAFLVAVLATGLWWRLRVRRPRRRTGPPAVTGLYRVYDVESRLLYVGITNHLMRRTSQHEESKPWWWQVRRMEVEWFPTREAALYAEERAIKRERPRHNIVHSLRRSA